MVGKAKMTTKSASKKNKTTENKSVDQLKTDLISKQNDLLEAKRGHKLGELTNPHVITITRREIARLHFAIHTAEMKPIKEDK